MEEKLILGAVVACSDRFKAAIRDLRQSQDKAMVCIDEGRLQDAKEALSRAKEAELNAWRESDNARDLIEQFEES